MPDIRYKVVSLCGNKRLSTTVSCFPWAKLYVPGEWTDASSGGLFVFKTHEAALNFSSTRIEFGIAPIREEIWTCECDGLLPPIDQLLVINVITTKEDIEQFWENPLPEEGRWMMQTLPETERYLRVKLLNRVSTAQPTV